MQYRTGTFILLATTVLLLASKGNSAVDEEVYKALPGGGAALPEFTRVVLVSLAWFATWWWLCLMILGGVLFGGPLFLSRTEGGRRFLESASDGMKRMQFVVMAIYVAGMFSLFWAIDLGLHLPLQHLLDALTGGG